MFRSLGIFNYRVWFIGGLVSNIGEWMQTTVQGWVVLTMLTRYDAAAMGVTVALQFAPTLLLAGVSGWVADRFDRRRVILSTQSALLVLSVILGALLLTGLLTLSIMFVFALAMGTVTAIDKPARQAFVSDLVGPSLASNAIGLNATAFNAARIVGPAIAGIAIVLIDPGWVFLANGLTFLGMIVAIVVMRRDELIPRIPGMIASRLAGGFHYVRRRPDIAVTFVMVFLIGAFGMNFPIFASTMALEFGEGAPGFGLLVSVFAIGALGGTLLAAHRQRARLTLIVGGGLAFGVSSAVSSIMPTYWWYAATVVPIGFSIVATLPTANAYVQSTTDPRLRGRVLAIYLAVLIGGSAVGAPLLGWVVSQWGPKTGILIGSLGGIAAFLIGATWLVTSGRVHRSGRLALRIDDTVPLDAFTFEVPHGSHEQEEGHDADHHQSRRGRSARPRWGR